MKRGEVWFVRLESIASALGREQAGTRPAVIVSTDDFHRSGHELVTIVPITSKARPFPSRIPIALREGSLSGPSFIIGEQVRTISVKRLIKRRGVVSTATMARVDDVLRLLLGL